MNAHFPLVELPARDGALELAADGTHSVHASAAGKVLLPGSFNPIHEGHWKLAQTAQMLLGRPVAFELSLANVDKPDLAWEEVRWRAQQFQGKATLWITRAPTFLLKSELFPQAVFVIGADTAERVLQPHYYAAEGVSAALRLLKERGCRFLVAGRLDSSQRFRCRHDLPIPPEFDDLFNAISPGDFRVDLSSTEIRRQGPDAAAANPKSESRNPKQIPN